ncbi:hypothetical protein EYF80_067886 [Liparis tanakae]|uniref:Uncharacterized protein n=1 Tax=Liparis tanakae TaxID=230148 RepID=A0A4Z2E0T5_9TELE|nr:hypothetical protein EYF80_067886 [Liparis tanakae]
MNVWEQRGYLIGQEPQARGERLQGRPFRRDPLRRDPSGQPLQERPFRRDPSGEHLQETPSGDPFRRPLQERPLRRPLRRDPSGEPLQERPLRRDPLGERLQGLYCPPGSSFSLSSHSVTELPSEQDEDVYVRYEKCSFWSSNRSLYGCQCRRR